jgi:hypothetical protein
MVNWNRQSRLPTVGYANDLPEGTQIIVTLDAPAESVRDAESAEWYALSLQGLNRAYSDDEPEYDLSQVKEFNPDYEGR